MPRPFTSSASSTVSDWYDDSVMQSISCGEMPASRHAATAASSAS